MRRRCWSQSVKSIFLVCTFFLPATVVLAEKKREEKPKAAQSIAQLRQQLQKVLQDTHTPGASVAIVHRDGPEWIAGLGTSNVAANQAVTEETLFRIGSVSKGFVSLSILKLVNEGKLSLNDPVHKLVPEIWFENHWEATDPARVVDLLEHTTGWDDLHLREYAKNAKGHYCFPHNVRKAVATGRRAAEIAGNTPPRKPISKANRIPPSSSGGVTLKANARWANV